MLIYLFYSKILASYSFIITQFDKRKHPASLQGACIPIGFCTGISDPSLNTPSTACTKYQLLVFACFYMITDTRNIFPQKIRIAGSCAATIRMQKFLWLNFVPYHKFSNFFLYKQKNLRCKIPICCCVIQANTYRHHQPFSLSLISPPVYDWQKIKIFRTIN